MAQMTPPEAKFILWRHKAVAVIPCFNEAANIAKVISGVQAHVQRIIVVDDGSDDGTAAASKGAEVIRHPARRGKGEALKTGWLAAKEAEWVLFMDGDGQHAPGDIPKFFAEAERSAAKMIIGNRMNSTCEMPIVRRFVNRWMSQRLSAACGCPVLDSQSGFRLVHLPTLLSLEIEPGNFEIESELILKFARAGARISFVPVQTIYGRTRSRIRPVNDSIRWFKWWFRNAPRQAMPPLPKTTCKRT